MTARTGIGAAKEVQDEPDDERRKVRRSERDCYRADADRNHELEARTAHGRDRRRDGSGEGEKLADSRRAVRLGEGRSANVRRDADQQQQFARVEPLHRYHKISVLIKSIFLAIDLNNFIFNWLCSDNADCLTVLLFPFNLWLFRLRREASFERNL